jgi:TetR/AcrR family transcriptional regulator, cholesterol catabolism regulator
MTDLAQLIDEGVVTDPESAKGRLLREASQLFKEKGFTKTTVRDIAAAVGILSGSIFHHFPNKEDILRCVMEETIRLSLARLKSELEGVEAIDDQIKTLIRCELDAIYGRGGQDFTILVSEWRSLNTENQAKVLGFREVYENLWHQVFNDAQKQGLSPLGGVLLRGFVRGALVDTINWYQPDGELSLEQLAEQVYMAFFGR